MSEVRQRRARVNGVELDVNEAGRQGDPLIVLAHGFPESAYSWRHQLLPLAAAGYHVIAPDQRGYAGSTRPAAVSDYGIEQLTGDLLGLVDQAGHEQAIFVGHDWGALIVWDLARLYPERVRAVVGVSVPFTYWPLPPTQLFKMAMGDRFFYMLYFQEVGPADEEMGRNPHTTLRNTLWGASGDAYESMLARSEGPQAAGRGNRMARCHATCAGDTAGLGHRSRRAALRRQFTRSGFFGPISYYRNLDANYELVKDLPPSRLTMPSYFIGGSKDFVVTRGEAPINAMPELLPGFRGSTIIEGAGTGPAGAAAAISTARSLRSCRRCPDWPWVSEGRGRRRGRRGRWLVGR